MKSFLAGFLFLLISLTGLAQIDTQKIADSLIQEGKRLYRLEMASWHGTDIFLERYESLRNHISAYFSYAVAKQTTCIFFSRDENPKVLLTITFDSSFNTSTAKVDDIQREFTVREKEIYTLRKLAKEMIYSDSLFKTYKNTTLNIIPIVDNNEKKVYVLSGTELDDVVFIGNDYLVTFDKQNKTTSKRQLHANILPINYKLKNGENGESAFHSHVPQTGEFITATDICTLMLYQHLAKWKTHYVISTNYVSIWDCEKNDLIILTREAWDKIYRDNK